VTSTGGLAQVSADLAGVAGATSQAGADVSAGDSAAGQNDNP
jgi:hypothetical protein